MADIRELTTEAEWLQAFPVLSQLRDHLTEASFLEYARQMRAEGYRLFALVEGASTTDEPASPRAEDDSAQIESESIVAVAGVAIRTNFYNGRHLFVYDLVTRTDRRSEGHGTRLMDFLEEWAREHDCESMTLESGLWRDDAHRFYEDDCGMDRYCYTFKKAFDEI